tara:strand:+ start:1233 stop:1583 length:351 start_codon:yes stop_codon:yes gene_type:complete
MSDSTKKAKKEGRYTPVLTFSLMLDANNSLNPAIEISKVDADDFIEYMDEYMPDFDYTHDIANLMKYCTALIESMMSQMEEYCGSVTDIQYPAEPIRQEVPDLPTLHQRIKSKKLN